MSAFKDRKIRQAYRDTFNTVPGQIVLSDLMNEGCILRPCYTPGDPHHTNFSEGARSIVLGIIDKLDKDEAYLRELEARRKRRARALDEGEMDE